jgi:hypothetical protein
MSTEDFDRWGSELLGSHHATYALGSRLIILIWTLL